MKKHTNSLIHESSPYLLQHAHNPVDWVPWSEDVFKRAAEENKLVLISVGYSSCHWCHVMEHECFEDEAVAAVMNRHFINVKVDREERPDVDQVYMTAVQLMTQRGGWPLNCFTLPDGRPLYGGTYFPKEQWLHVLGSIRDTWDKDPHRALEYAEKLHEGIQQ
ncbi:MAG: thioredoxin domain-containing protein, partial [Bacteroidota bacterium]